MADVKLTEPQREMMLQLRLRTGGIPERSFAPAQLGMLRRLEDRRLVQRWRGLVAGWSITDAGRAALSKESERS